MMNQDLIKVLQITGTGNQNFNRKGLKCYRWLVLINNWFSPVNAGYISCAVESYQYKENLVLLSRNAPERTWCDSSFWLWNFIHSSILENFIHFIFTIFCSGSQRSGNKNSFSLNWFNLEYDDPKLMNFLFL